MNKEDIKDIIQKYTNGYKDLVKTHKDKLGGLTTFSLSKEGWNKTALENLFKNTDEPELDSIKDTLNEVKGYFLETFRDARLENKEDVKEWCKAFKEEIDTLSDDSQHRNTFR